MLARLLASGCVALPVVALGQSPNLVSIDLSAQPTRERHPHLVHAVDKAQRIQALTLRARSITIEGPWSKAADIGFAVCDVVTPERISIAMEALESAITRAPASLSTLGSQGEAEVLWIEVDFDTSDVPNSCGGDGKTVAVKFRPYHVRLALQRVGDNVLPLPRFSFASIYARVPAPLRVLNPSFGVSQDRAFGSAASVALHTDLRTILAAAAPNAASAQTPPIDAHFEQVQSARAGFHRSSGGMAYRIKPQTGSQWQEVRLRIDGAWDREPLAGSELSHAATEFGFGVSLKPASGVRLHLDTGWRGARDDTEGDAAPAVHVETRRIASRALLDTQLPAGSGFIRAAVWHEAARIDDAGHFHRVAAQVGYAGEFAFGGSPTWGVELMAGAGRLSGGTPAFDRYFGGNPPGQFLYDGVGSATLLQAPRGPLIRSFGQAQASLAGQRGGSRYWHLNGSVALPLSALSRPLIPDEKIGVGDVTLKDVLRTQVDKTAPAMLAATLRFQGMSSEEAQRRAEASLAEVQPAAHFVIDKASLFAIRPLVLVDMSGLTDGASRTTARWLAVGAGIGVTVITARLEAGYMRTVSGPRAEGARGAAFLRLVFENIF